MPTDDPQDDSKPPSRIPSLKAYTVLLCFLKVSFHVPLG